MSVENRPEILPQSSILGIFAHPDDESFAAGGFFSFASRLGSSVYMFTLTSGEAGVNYSPVSSKKSLQEIRENELKAVCEIMGIPLDSIFLGHLPDGKLCDRKEEIASLVKEKIFRLKPAIVVAMHPNSTTHPDHKTIGEFLIQLKLKGDPETQFLLYLQFLPNKYTPTNGEEIFILKLDQELFDKKKELISQHQSQQPDIDRILPNLLQEEYFIIFR